MNEFDNFVEIVKDADLWLKNVYKIEAGITEQDNERILDCICVTAQLSHEMKGKGTTSDPTGQAVARLKEKEVNQWHKNWCEMYTLTYKNLSIEDKYIFELIREGETQEKIADRLYISRSLVAEKKQKFILQMSIHMQYKMSDSKVMQ